MSPAIATAPLSAAEKQEIAEAELASERAAVARLSDTEVLARVGKLGPGIVGRALFERAQTIRSNNPDGRLGPAILDPDYAAKQAVKRKRERDGAAAEEHTRGTEVDPDSEAAGDPWQWTTLSGAKQLAQAKGVSYPPRIKRDELVEALKAAGVEPPAPPDDSQDDED